MADRRWLGLGLVLVFLYLRTLSGLPVDWDDPVWILEDPILALSPGQAVWTAFTTPRDNVYAPLLRLSFAAQLAATGGSVAALHAATVSLFLGGVAGLAVLLPRLGVGTTATFAALGLWALHPTRVESVAWLTGLKDTQSLALLVGAALCWVPAGGAPSARRVAAGTALALAALLTRAAVFPVPFVLAGVLGAKEGPREAARRLGPSCALALALAAVGAVVWTPVSGHPPLPWSRAVHALWVHGSFWSALWPAPRGAIVALPSTPWPLVVLGLVASGSWAWAARRDPRLAAALALWLAPQLPFLGGLSMAFWASDRHLLVASLGPALLAGWAVEKWAAARPVALAAALGLAWASWGRVPAWHDSQRLWEAELQRPGEHWARWYKVGMVWARSGRFAEATQAFDRSLALHPAQREVLAAWVIASLAADGDGFTRVDAGLAARFQPPPADEAAWREAARALDAAGQPALAGRIAAHVR
jgi:protein O-mannosyl-transferase